MGTLNAVITLLAAAAEHTSKTPFYVAGAALAGWAVVLAAIGMTRPDFPFGKAGQRAVMGISALLVASTLTAAVVTANTPHDEAKAESPASEGNSPAGAPAQALPAKPGAPAAGTTIALAADPTGEVRYDKTSLQGKPGDVVIDFTNQSQIPHDVTIASGGKELGKTPAITGSTAKLEVKLTPGTYEYFCSVDSHRELGMKGTLKVS